jgi:hypothetical protein
VRSWREEATFIPGKNDAPAIAVRFLACTVFWLPDVGRLVVDVADEPGVRADDAATPDQTLALSSRS